FAVDGSVLGAANLIVHGARRQHFDVIVYLGHAFDSFDGCLRVILGYRLPHLARQGDFGTFNAVLQVVEDAEPRYLDEFVAYFTCQPCFVIFAAAVWWSGSLSAFIPGEGACRGNNAQNTNC